MENMTEQALMTSRQQMETPHSVCETVLSWLRNPVPSDVAEQTAHWQESQWEAARWATQVHGIAPILYARLGATTALEQLDPTLQTYLADQYRLNQQRVSAMMTELADLLQAAHEADIAVIPLKGSVLVSHYYADPALRPMADLDVLVAPADEVHLARVVQLLGYQATETTPRHRSYVLAHPGTRIVSSAGEHPDNPHGLDVHTAICEEFWGIRYQATAALWSGWRPALFGAAPGLLLEPMALLHHLLIHASTDMIAGKARLIRLFDIALVAAHLSQTDWQRLVDEGQRRREERLLYAPLLLAERYLGGVMPADVCATLAQGTPKRLRAFLERTDLYQLSFCNPHPIPLNDKLCWYRPGREQVAVLRTMMLPTPQELRHWYPHMTRRYQLPRAYLTHAMRTAIWPIRRMLNLPRRAWVYRSRGGA